MTSKPGPDHGKFPVLHVGCSIEGCDRDHYGKTWCNMHYQRWYKNGHPLATKVIRDDEVARAECHIEKTETCWLWTGTTSRGYGCASVSGRMMPAHRWVYSLFRGPIPEGMTLDHECHNRDLSCPGGDSCLHRRCVNPDHMAVRTQRENSRASRTRLRRAMAKAACLAVSLSILTAVLSGVQPKQALASTSDFSCPVPGSTFIDSWHAPRVGHLHVGTDLMAPDGTPIVAPEAGTYRPYSPESFYLDGDSGTEWFGTHLQEHVAPAGRVEQGQTIALVGHTGNASASAPHLHIEQRPRHGEPVNPYPAMFAACFAPTPTLREAAARSPESGGWADSLTWPYSVIEVQREWNRHHVKNIDRPTATALRNYLQAVVEQRLGAYLFALWLQALPVGSQYHDRAPLPAIRACESGGNYSAVSASGTYRGAYQFDRQTWNGVAGRHRPALVGVDPASASVEAQDHMAWMLYTERGTSPWPVCGSR